MIQKTHQETGNSTHDINIVLMAENIRTPENVGMIMRLSEAFGVNKIYFSGEYTIDLTTKVKRASRNTYRTMNYEFVTEGEKTLSMLRERGYHSIAIEITNRSTPFQKFRSGKYKNMVLVIGSERKGISEEMLQLCQDHYHINMFGENSSLNVANALAIGLYKITE